MKPEYKEIHQALNAAGKAHHDYQVNYLNGKRDETWAGWYAAYVLGRLGDVMQPTELTNILENVQTQNDWFEDTASAVYDVME